MSTKASVFWLVLMVVAAFVLGMAFKGTRVAPNPETESFIEMKVRCTPEGDVEWIKHPKHMR